MNDTLCLAPASVMKAINTAAVISLLGKTILSELIFVTMVLLIKKVFFTVIFLLKVAETLLSALRVLTA